MSEFTLFSLPPVVLSFGRSASIQLCLWLKNYFPELLNPSLPVNHIETAADFPVRYPGVIHSHALIKPRLLRNHTKIFALRKDPVETIISWMTARQYDRYHLNPGNVNDVLAPFMVKNWSSVDGHCSQYIKWHRYYSKQIDQWSFVIVLETLLERLDPELHQPVYPDKSRLMLNVDEVRNYITDKYLPEMLESTQPFLYHTNPGDLYAEFNPQRLTSKALSSS